MSNGREALVVCSDRSTVIGMTVWDVDTGHELLRIPTCAAAAHGLVSLRNQHLVASQLNRHGSIGSGSIFIWAMNKPHSPLRCYTMEAVGPLCCTRDGLYLAGGASSGNIYLWEVSSGKLLKSWHAHHKLLKCMTFSDDGSLLISGSDDGMICVWSMISLLDSEVSRSFSALLHYSSEHTSSVTALLTISASAGLTFISSSLDATCKVWDLISGRLKKTIVHDHPVTAIALHPVGQLLFSGSIDGSITVNKTDDEAIEDPLNGKQNQPVVLEGHNESITALNFCKSGLISASKDCTVCLWNIESRVIIRRFDHPKGPVTNLVIVPGSSLLSPPNNQRGFDQNHVSLLEKCHQPINSIKEMITLVPSFSCLGDDQSSICFQATGLLDQQLLSLEQEHTVAGMQMKVETAMECRAWAMNMAKHVVEMNKDMRSCLLDMMQLRLWPDEINSTEAITKRNNRRRRRRRRLRFSKSKDRERGNNS